MALMTLDDLKKMYPELMEEHKREILSNNTVDVDEKISGMHDETIEDRVARELKEKTNKIDD